jgi:hypothetical protein
MRAKIVNEAQNFTKDTDIKGSLGIGMMGQLKQLAKSQGHNIEEMDDVGFFLAAALKERHDLMDYLIKKGLDINSQEHEILRVLAWQQQEHLGIHLIQKRGADLDGAIKDAKLHNEWKTVRGLEEMKRKIQRTKSFPVKENLDFERGVDPKASMGIGGINFNKNFNDFVEEWAIAIKKAVEGKTITAYMTKYWTTEDGRSQEGRKQNQTIKVKEIRISAPDTFSGKNMFFTCYLTSEDEEGDDLDTDKYKIDLNQKIYISDTRAKNVNELQDFERGSNPRGTMELGGINFQEKFRKDFNLLYNEYADNLQKLEGKTITCEVIIGHAPVKKRIKVSKVLEMGIQFNNNGARGTEDDNMTFFDMIFLSQYIEGEIVGERDPVHGIYRLNLASKIYIE